MENKKGQGLSITTLILIIIGVVILVVLIFGFTSGWGNIKEWIAPSSNVDKIVTSCNVACASEMIYDWCERELTLKVKGEEDTATCKTFSASGSTGLSISASALGVKDCPAIVNQC